MTPLIRLLGVESRFYDQESKLVPFLVLVELLNSVPISKVESRSLSRVIILCPVVVDGEALLAASRFDLLA